MSTWQASINEMMRRIPSFSAEGMNAYFDSIDSRLIVYGNLMSEAPTLFPEQLGSDYGVVMNILTFL